MPVPPLPVLGIDTVVYCVTPGPTMKSPTPTSARSHPGNSQCRAADRTGNDGCGGAQRRNCRANHREVVVADAVIEIDAVIGDRRILDGNPYTLGIVIERDADLGADDGQVGERHIARPFELEIVEAGGRSLAVEDCRETGLRRPLDGDGLRRQRAGPGIRRAKYDIVGEVVGAGIDIDDVAGAERVFGQQRAERRHG